MMRVEVKFLMNHRDIDAFRIRTDIYHEDIFAQVFDTHEGLTIRYTNMDLQRIPDQVIDSINEDVQHIIGNRLY